MILGCFSVAYVNAQTAQTGKFVFFLAHLNHWLMVGYCDHLMSVVRRALCVVRRQQLLQRTSPKLLAEILQNLTGMILIWPSLIIVRIGPARSIYRSHRLK